MAGAHLIASRLKKLLTIALPASAGGGADWRAGDRALGANRVGRVARHAGLFSDRCRCAASGWLPATTAGLPACRCTSTRWAFAIAATIPLDKPPDTFRILVLGDSVTFGHGTLDDTTYPYLLEQRLRGWRPDVNWEVWNLGVPGYNTRQELAYLKEIGPRAQPDLVMVGFFPTISPAGMRPSRRRRCRAAPRAAIAAIRATARVFVRVLQARRADRALAAVDLGRRPPAHRASRHRTATARAIRIRPIADAPEQRLTEVEYLNDPAARDFECDSGAHEDTDRHDHRGCTDPPSRTGVRRLVRDGR